MAKPSAKSSAQSRPRTDKKVRHRSLLVIDNDPIRKAALAAYLKLEKESGNLSRQIEAFQTVDVPAYQRWEAKVLGPMLTELRDLDAKAAEKQRVLDAIDEEMYWTNCSELTAYRRVMKLIEEPESEAPKGGAKSRETADFDEEDPGADGGGDRLFGDSDLPPGFGAAKFDRMKPREQMQFREWYGMMASIFAAMTGRAGPNLDEALRRDREGATGGGDAAHDRARTGSGSEHTAQVSPAERHQADRLKDLYRKLVRLLHPDAGGQFTARQRDLWHEVQTAYQQRDLERLEAVAGRIEMGHAGASPHMPVSLITRMSRDLHAALRSLRSQIAKARRQPAWRFKKSQDPVAFEAVERKRLSAALREVEAFHASVSRVLDNLAERAARPPKARKTKGKPAAPARKGSRADQMSFF